tara:strand:+ start:611 stop:781 length:171 start_codon:yes stop_codon:yes gene_type:complete
VKKIIFLLFVVGCSSKTLEIKDKHQSLNFDKNLSFNEFMLMLDKYNKITDYPNLDE